MPTREQASPNQSPARSDWYRQSVDWYRDQQRDATIMGREKRLRRAAAYDLLDWSRIDTLVDVGVGAGRWLNACPNADRRLVGVDINPEFLDAVRRPAEGVRGDASALPLQTDSVDAISCLGVLGHLPNDMAVDRPLAEFARVLRPGGQLVVSVGHPGLARQIRSQYQRARGLGKRLTGLGSPESRYRVLGTERVIRALEPAGCYCTGIRYVTLTPGLSDRLERPLSRVLDRLVGREGPSRRALAQTAVLKFDTADE